MAQNDKLLAELFRRRRNLDCGGGPERIENAGRKEGSTVHDDC